MEASTGKEGCIKSKQGHAGSGYPRRKEIEGFIFPFEAVVLIFCSISQKYKIGKGGIECDAFF